MTIVLLVVNIIFMIALGIVSVLAILIGHGVFDDPDGKESNPEYWKTLQMMRAREKERKKNGQDN